MVVFASRLTVCTPFAARSGCLLNPCIVPWQALRARGGMRPREAMSLSPTPNPPHGGGGKVSGGGPVGPPPPQHPHEGRGQDKDITLGISWLPPHRAQTATGAP
ncbi:MAG: hypothetical protein NVSMB65_04360 [Chloroflexota bacterium]